MAQRSVPSFNVGWRHLYEVAMLEADYGLLPGRITEARRAILDRAEEVLTGNAPIEERQALSDGLRALRVLEDNAIREKTQH
jgi:hypothetical protein